MQLHLLPVALLALLASTISAQVPIPQPSAQLLSWNGQDPCELKQLFAKPCSPPSSRLRLRDDNDDNDTTQPRVTPNPCTCSNVYFNLWSACLSSTPTGLANSTLPVCGQLEEDCAQSSFNITVQPPPEQETSYPPWAYTALPASNGTFDIAAAVQSASTSQQHKWTVIQIVVPIIAGFTVGIVLLVAFYFYRRRKNPNRRGMSAGTRGHFHFPSISSLNKVREVNRSTSWSIDDPREDLQEYQFVSYPSSLQGSHTSGHVRLSSSSSGTTPAGPPMLKIPRDPIWAWPGKSMFQGSLHRIPRPWRSTKRVAVQNMPGYRKFRVDGTDSDSPLSRRPHEESLLGHYAGRSRTNLQNEAIFENEDDSDSDSEAEALPLIPEQHSVSNHDAQPAPVIASSPPQADSLSRVTPRPIPPLTAPPTTALPLPPPLQQSPTRTSRTTRSHPAFPPAPTSPPPPPPTVTRRTPRAPRPALPTFPPELIPSAPPPIGAPPPRRRQSSEGTSIVLPDTPTPPYIPATRPAPVQVSEDVTDSPPNSAPPYILRPSQDLVHSPLIPAVVPQNQRAVRRLPLLPS
ncbi:hypothetical protein FB45DRAFT_904480 [Roridomyces roridus]|uniref:Mid2 domain-containing protein n=1 Tax=Roridomyces roridus TaxID=1738132 RepID=A0AAD7C4Z1_9AGAR|nr:hypothetical protein FB45DRAFT_904480 [Roridomyces roridus]